MSSVEESSNPLRFPVRADPLASPFMANIMLATTPHIVQSLLPPATTTGRVREYSQVGDGVHMRQQSLPLLPLVERARPRPHTLVRKVSVVGSHVLRYVGRHSSLSTRRPQFRNLQRMSPIDQQLNYVNTFNYDRVDDIDWVEHNDEAPTSSSGLLHIQPESYAVRLMLPPNSEDNSLLGLFNWKIYLGMLCIIAVQALLKLAYQQMYSIS